MMLIKTRSCSQSESSVDDISVRNDETYGGESSPFSPTYLRDLLEYTDSEVYLRARILPRSPLRGPFLGLGSMGRMLVSGPTE